jgi:tetratricopeptide (TPR) repeat protein
MPEAAAALHLRAAAMATASGEPDLSLARVAAARTVDPDDVGALLVAAEHSATALAPQPGEDPAAAIDRLLARADILAMRSTLADDPAARDGWELDRAEALEAAGRLKEAGAAVAGVLRGAPADLRALTALHRLAKRGGDRSAQARAAVALAQRSADPETKRQLWSDAVAILDPGGHGAPPNRSPGADVHAAIAVYRQMVTDDPGSAAFDRLRQLLRGGGDVRGLVLALGARLAWADGSGDRDAGVPMLMERAEIRRALGDRHAARADLDNLLERAPDHAAALRMQAEIALELGDAQRAVELWRRYISAETDATRRGEADILLSKLLAEDMGDVNGAILQLERVIAQNPRDVALRERMVGLATRANDWTRAARELRELVRLRQSPGERARDELRLGQLLRDRMSDRREAHAAFERGRQLDPLNLDLLHELAELVGAERPGARADVIGKGIDDLRSALSTSPGTTVVYERLAAAFGWLGDRDGQWLALGVLEALATPTPEQKQLLTAGRSRDLPPIAKLPFDNNARAALRAPGSEGVLTEIWRAAGPAIAATVGVDPARLGFARGDKIATKALGKKYEALAAGLASLGLEAELYVSDARGGAAWAIAGETPLLCLGGDVASGATPMSRYLLGRALWLAADGAGTLADLKEQEVVWFLIAALRAAELQVPPALTEIAAGEEAAVADRAKMVAKHMARRDRKTIAALAPRLGHFGEPLGWRRAKLASAQRLGLLYAGDLAVALGAMDVGRGGRHIATDPAALELASWSVSAAYLELRRTRQMALSAGGSR